MGFSPDACSADPGDKPLFPSDGNRLLLSPASDLSLESPTLARTLSHPIWQTEASVVESAAGVIDAQPRPVPKQLHSSATTSQSQYRRELVKYHSAPNRPFALLRLGEEDAPLPTPTQSIDPSLPRTLSVDRFQASVGAESAPVHFANDTLVELSSGNILQDGDPRMPPSQTQPPPPALDFLPKAPFSPICPHPTLGPLTPPAEHGETVWGKFSNLTTLPLHSPETDEGLSFSQPASNAPAEPDSQSELSSTGDRSGFDIRMGIEGAINTLGRNLQTTLIKNSSIRILSHVLPCPSLQGQAFTDIISAIQGSTPASPMVWINILHAVPGRFNLGDLPKSPPATPGPAVGGEDYFTQRVFDSAVAISDYQHEFPRTPCLAVQPASLNVSVIERYIPPTSTNEFSDMFNIKGPSILVDRLVELSPNNGTLIFIYPTKAGGETFMRDYLSPLLDPLLRSIVVVNGLSTDLSIQLGQMKAVDKLPSYDTLQRRTRDLCNQLSRHSSEIDRFYGRSANFALTYASRYEVQLSRDVWAAGWWAKQEKVRIRETMQRYVQDAQSRISHERAARMGQPVALMQELLDGVGKRAYPSGEEPRKGIEVAVFVITRSEGSE